MPEPYRMTPTGSETGEDPLGNIVSEATRATMRANRGRDSAPELAVRSLIHAAGLRYRVCAPLPIDRRRRADITFTRVELFVFIDGCFWHRCPEHFQMPKSNIPFWAGKVATNVARDIDTTTRLEAEGLTVLRFWEHEAPDAIAAAIVARYRCLRSGLGGVGYRRDL
jgi:DNA mismatch endonuclease, patch repair protein